MKLSRATIALYVGLVFASGVAVGAVGFRLYNTVSVSAKTTTNVNRSPEEYRKRYLTEMKARLGLTDDQATKLNAILDATQARYRESHERQMPELQAIRQGQADQIHAILTKQQGSEYDRIVKEREERQKQKKGRGDR